MAKLTVPFNGGSGGKKEPLKNQVYDINESEQPITLGEEIANLKNWYYDTEQRVVDGATKPVFDTVNLLANSQAILNSGLLEGEWTAYALYVDYEKLAMQWDRDYSSGVIKMSWYVMDAENERTDVYENTITPAPVVNIIWDGTGEPPAISDAPSTPTSVWQKYTITQEMVDNNIEPTKITITSQDELPDIVIDPSCIAPDYENVFPEFYEVLKETQDVDLTLGEKVADLKNWTYEITTPSSELEDKVYNVKMQGITGIDFSSKSDNDIIAASRSGVGLYFFPNNGGTMCINYYYGKAGIDWFYNPTNERWESYLGEPYDGAQLTFDLIVESVVDEDSLKKILEMPTGAPVQVSLKEKFDSVDAAIENVTNNMETGYLKDRAYEKITVEHGRTYKPKLNMNITQETLDTIFSGFSDGDEIYYDGTKGSWIMFYSNEYTISLNYKPNSDTDSINYIIADSRFGWNFVNMWRIGGISVESQSQLPSMLINFNAINTSNENAIKVIQLMFETEPTLGDKIENIKDLTYFRTSTGIKPFYWYTLPKQYDLSQFELPNYTNYVVFDNDNDLFIGLTPYGIQVTIDNVEKYYRGGVAYNNWYDSNNDLTSPPEVRFTDEELGDIDCVKDLDTLEKILGIVKTTFRQKFATCLTLERLENIEINANDIEVNYDYSEYSDAGYEYLVTIQNDAFKDALKVEVLFSIAQVDAGKICPLQEINTEYGVLTLFLKDASNDIVLNRIDIFKYNTDTAINDDGSDRPTPSPDPIAGGQLI